MQKRRATRESSRGHGATHEIAVQPAIAPVSLSHTHTHSLSLSLTLCVCLCFLGILYIKKCIEYNGYIQSYTYIYVCLSCICVYIQPYLYRFVFTLYILLHACHAHVERLVHGVVHASCTLCRPALHGTGTCTRVSTKLLRAPSQDDCRRCCLHFLGRLHLHTASRIVC